ncbi:D-alanyl-D-alanine dipeptidase [Pusillimonas sp.]|uniref:D-alanyl-D-alanine dipeptidase n=1 Tax=Pusillimonas sp. TaxID=3040095 RepID=UPI0037C91E21
MPAEHLVHIEPSTYPVEIDLVYAGSNNFVCLPIYAADAPCLLHRDAAACLMRAAVAARRSGLTLKIFDAYRPPAAQEVLWRLCPNPQYVADPAVGSNHSRGVAVDVTLLDESGKALDMGTGFDEMREQSHHDRDDLPAPAQRNRTLLLGIMLHAGFASLPTEWWHYQLNDAAKYPLRFEEGVSLVEKTR